MGDKCFAFGAILSFLFYVVYIFYASQRLDDFVVRFILFEFLAFDGEFECVHAQSRIDKRRIEFHVVYAHTKFSQRCHKGLQVVFVEQFEVQLEVIGALFEILFEGREKLQNHNIYGGENERDGVHPRAEKQAEDAARSKPRRRRKSFYLILCAEQNRVSAQHCSAYHRTCRANRKSKSQRPVDNHTRS